MVQKALAISRLSSLHLRWKCKSAETAFWAVSFMRLYIDRGFMSHGEMTFRSLTGRNTNQKGWLDVVLEKKTVLAWLQGPFADKLGLAESHKALPAGFQFSVCPHHVG